MSRNFIETDLGTRMDDKSILVLVVVFIVCCCCCSLCSDNSKTKTNTRTSKSYSHTEKEYQQLTSVHVDTVPETRALNTTSQSKGWQSTERENNYVYDEEEVVQLAIDNGTVLWANEMQVYYITKHNLLSETMHELYIL